MLPEVGYNCMKHTFSKELLLTSILLGSDLLFFLQRHCSIDSATPGGQQTITYLYTHTYISWVHIPGSARRLSYEAEVPLL